jgi:hypothetical protein
MIPLRSIFRNPLVVLLLAFRCFQLPVHAGGSGECTVGVERFGEEAIRNLALVLNDELDARKVNVAIVARAGRLRSQMPRGINYTHLAFVVFEPVVAADGTTFHTYTAYNLYQGEKGEETRSYLKQDFTYNLVAGIAEPDVAVCVPVDVLQRRILTVIRSPAYRALHTPEYNLVTNPWVDRFDNCVTHALKICVAAIYQTEDRARIYDNIRHYFKPTPVRFGPLKSIGTAFVPALRREDCDPAGLQTATYDSLLSFLATNGLVKESFTVSVKGEPVERVN